VIYGLTAAVMWGTSAVTATIAARKTGTFITVLVGQAVGMVVLVVLVVVLRPSFSEVGGTNLVGLIGAGLIGLVGYLSFYRALELGPVGLVSAIGSSYGGVAAVLAFVVLDERLGVAGTTGVALAVVGVSLAAARAHAARETVSLSAGEPLVGVVPSPTATRPGTRAGIPFAFISAASYGVGGFLLGYFSGRVGWLAATLITRLAALVVLAAIVPFLGRPSAWRGTGSGVAWAAAAGLTDIVGVMAFARGGQAAQIAITSAVSSIYPIIPLAAGIAMFDERLGRRQVLGVGLIVVGLILLGLVGAGS
jgi:drug/metabolite transporter (DMT)-like permease